MEQQQYRESQHSSRLHVKVRGERMARLLFSCPVRSDSWWPHGLQYARPPCLPSLSLVRVCRKTDSKGEDFQNVCDLWLRKCRNYTSRNYPKEWNDHQYMWTLFFSWFYVSLLATLPACRILVTWPRIEPVPPAVEARSLYHWTVRESPTCEF